MSDIRKAAVVQYCTKENPWSEDADTGGRVVHKDAHEVGEQEDGWPGGDMVTIECPNCRKRWKQELPQ